MTTEQAKIKALLDARNEMAHRKLRHPDWREKIILRREVLA